MSRAETRAVWCSVHDGHHTRHRKHYRYTLRCTCGPVDKPPSCNPVELIERGAEKRECAEELERIAGELDPEYAAVKVLLLVIAVKWKEPR